MVGVPGKSKGCSTCRRRKKGCDQKRPSCGQCVQSGNTCGGYEREITFIVHPATKLAEKSYYVTPNVQTSAIVIIPASLDRSTLETQCRALFWDLYLPHGTAEANDVFLQKCNHPPNWVSVLLELAHDETSLDLAFSALSIARVGRSSNDMRLVKESTKIYGKALKDLQRALHDPSRMHSEEVLAACSLLGLYEMFEGGAASGRSVGWVSHAQGAARLIELRGPDKHINRQAHHVFLGARVPIVYAAILRRKGTFLASEDWTNLPWQKCRKTKCDQLVDILTEIPDVLEHFDNLRTLSASPETRQGLLSLLTTCSRLREALNRWEEGKCPNARPVTIRHERQANDTYPFEHKLSWENHLFMNGNLIFWTGHLTLLTTITQIELLLASLGSPRPEMDTTTATAQQQARSYAICIAQSIPYCLMPDMGALGISYITFPMCLAFKHFLESNEDVVCSWMVQICNAMRRHGLRIRPFDDSLSTENLDDTGIVFSRQSSSDRESVESPSAATTPVPASSSETPDVELGLYSPVAGKRIFRSTFIFENPAKYYIDSTEPD